jgi:hypothetical protein
LPRGRAALPGLLGGGFAFGKEVSCQVNFPAGFGQAGERTVTCSSAGAGMLAGNLAVGVRERDKLKIRCAKTHDTNVNHG